MAAIGILSAERSVAFSKNEVQKWLRKLSGISEVFVSISVNSNVAQLFFKYGGSNYEFRSVRQKNARLNLFAIVKAMEGKVRNHFIGI